MHQELRSVLLPFVAACGLLTSGPASWAENSQLTVSVYNDALVAVDTLRRAEEQAGNTFRQAGFDITWINCTETRKSCEEGGGQGQFALRITPRVIASISDMALGIAFVGTDEDGRNADVFWKRVKQVQEASRVDAGLLLGSVMAHEIGHLLLGSNSHSVSGLMREHWEAVELYRISMGSLLFLPEQANRMRVQLARQETATR